LVGRMDIDGFYFEIRIPLPHNVQHAWASSQHNHYFYGKKVITFPCGTSFLFVEMVGIQTDSYVPTEAASVIENHMASPSRFAAPAFASPAPAATMAPPPNQRPVVYEEAPAPAPPPDAMMTKVTPEETQAQYHLAVYQQWQQSTIPHLPYVRAPSTQAVKRRAVDQVQVETVTEDDENKEQMPPPITQLCVRTPPRPHQSTPPCMPPRTPPRDGPPPPVASPAGFKTTGLDDDDGSQWTEQTVYSTATQGQGPPLHMIQQQQQAHQQQTTSL